MGKGLHHSERSLRPVVVRDEFTPLLPRLFGEVAVLELSTGSGQVMVDRGVSLVYGRSVN